MMGALLCLEYAKKLMYFCKIIINIIINRIIDFNASKFYQNSEYIEFLKIW